MKVAIVGGGAIGLLIASYISPRHQVTIYTRTEKQAERLRLEGVTCKVGDGYRHYSVNAVCFAEGNINADIYIIAVKQYNMKDIFPMLLSLKGELLLFIQNGMGHIHETEKFQVKNIGVGIVGHGASKSSDTEVEHTGLGSITIGAVEGNTHVVESLFVEENFPIHYESNWKMIAMRKLIVNAVINPLTTLYRVENGMLVSNPHFFEIARKVFEEVYSVVGREEKEATWQYVLNVCESTRKNRSSMLKDVEEKRKTEIESIIGYIVNEANKNRIETPYLSFMYTSIKGLEETYLVE